MRLRGHSPWGFGGLYSGNQAHGYPLQKHTHTHSLAHMLALKRGVAWGTEKVFHRENVFIMFIRTGTLCITACVMDYSAGIYRGEKKKLNS